MNPLHPGVNPTVQAKDAIFFSPHKFIGGVDSPGILVAKKKLFKSSSPYTAGGGTVFYVSISHFLLPLHPTMHAQKYALQLYIPGHAHLCYLHIRLFCDNKVS